MLKEQAFRCEKKKREVSEVFFVAHPKMCQKCMHAKNVSVVKTTEQKHVCKVGPRFHFSCLRKEHKLRNIERTNVKEMG